MDVKEVQIKYPTRVKATIASFALPITAIIKAITVTKINNLNISFCIIIVYSTSVTLAPREKLPASKPFDFA